jgi:hypothetical protein
MSTQSPGAGPKASSKRLDLENGPTKYVDRPANEGKHGDAADEPNEGPPKDSSEPETTPARR